MHQWLEIIGQCRTLMHVGEIDLKECELLLLILTRVIRRSQQLNPHHQSNLSEACTTINHGKKTRFKIYS